ncbi:putative hexose phosphate transport protein [Xenorhabdus stockiae]|uniref:Putative hexose phosphate transport protein n=1 Tax=Xenorhabdus stockiae TaxID=351614 RepID=A0A2D0KL52_9GAMM|nr:putative hexose phosphate transport protein [Xenorhabdus stockiae]
MIKILEQVRQPTLDLPVDIRRKMWFKPFMQSYLVVFIGYMAMYLVRKNFNIAQNDMVSTYGFYLWFVDDAAWVDRVGVLYHLWRRQNVSGLLCR